MCGQRIKIHLLLVQDIWEEPVFEFQLNVLFIQALFHK